MTAKISVIAPLYNHEKYAEEAFQSVCSQTYDNWELIIWDDGSTDSSLKIACEFERKYPKKVKVYQHEDGGNHGQEATRNAAIAKSSGELLSLLDTDDYFYPQKLEKLIPWFEDQSVGLAYGKVEFINGSTGEKIATGIDNETFGKVFDELVFDNFICASGVIFRRKFIDQGMKFDSKFKTCGEYPLWLEISLTNKVAYLPEVVAVWRVHENNTGTKYSLKAKEELVFLKQELLLKPKFLKHEHAVRRALAKARYDYAAELYRELELGKMREICAAILADSFASSEQKTKAAVLISVSIAGKYPNKFLSEIKRAMFERKAMISKYTRKSI